MKLCEYKNILGLPNTGLHSFRVFDFAIVDVTGPQSVINGASYGIYGVVFNSFVDPVHGLLYIMAVCFLGLHLCHGVQSVVQTNGFNHPQWTPRIKKISEVFSLLMAIGYSSIPVYVYLKAHSS